MTHADYLEQEFRNLIHYIQEAAAMPENAMNIDTHMLSNKAAELCKTAERSPPQIATKMAPLMATLIEELDRLASRLETHNAKKGI